MKGQVKMRFRENGLEGNVLNYCWTLLDMVLVQEALGEKKEQTWKNVKIDHKNMDTPVR